MNKLQYDSFYKFIVSIGTLLIAAPVFGIYYLFTGSYDVLISRQEYAALSQISLASLQSREKLMRIIYVALPYVFFGLLAMGLFCIVWGGLKWYRIQKTLDESIQLDVDEKRYHYKKLTASEIAEKAAKDTKEAQGETDIPNLSKQSQRIAKTLEIESACFRYLNNKLSDRYKLQQNVKVKDMGYDVVAISKGDNIDFIYEIKYWTKANKSALIKTLFRLNKAGVNYEMTTRRNFCAKLLIVSDNANMDSIKDMVAEHFQNSGQTYSFLDVEYISEDGLLGD